MKKIKITSEYITLGQFLKFVDIISSGAMAKAFLLETRVLVNNEEENRRGRKLYPEDIINVENETYKVEK